MGKELTFTMSQQIIDMASKPLRKREDAILLLLYTIRMFDLDKSELNIHNESIRISINKMSFIYLSDTMATWFDPSSGSNREENGKAEINPCFIACK